MRAIAILQRLRPLVPRDDRRIAETLDSASTVDIDYSFSRADLKPFVAALREALDEATARLDTPASLGGALEQVIHDAGGAGHATVHRSPAGLHSPEYWHIQLRGLDRATGQTLERLVRGGPPA